MPDDTTQNGLGAARTYAELRKLVDQRRQQLRLKMWEVDVDAGLQDGYFAKIICGLRNFGPDTLGKILEALDVEIVLMPRLSAPSADAKYSLPARLHRIGSKGGRIARSRYTAAEWSKHCRHAARARWAKAGRAKPIRQHGATADLPKPMEISL